MPRDREIAHDWRHLTVALSFVAIAGGLAFFSSDITYDYQHYGGQWQHVLDSGNPWTYAVGDTRRFNAYGPLHSLMAGPYSVSTSLPKLIYALSVVMATLFLVMLARRSEALTASARTIVIAFLFLNPPLWILYVHGGFNDALIGALMLSGVAAYDRERFVLAAIFLAAGILYKFTPGFVVPFLCVVQRRVRWRFAVTLGVCLIAGFGLAYLAWGESLLAPISLGMDRPSSSTSIFNFIDKVGPNVDFVSMPLLMASLVALFGCYVVFNFEWQPSVVFALSCVLFFYRVGHIQFYLALTLLLIYFVITEYRHLSPWLIRSIACFLAWICCMVFLWKIGGHDWKQRLHAVIGLPTFVFHGWMNIALIQHLWRGREAARRGQEAPKHRVDIIGDES